MQKRIYPLRARPWATSEMHRFSHSSPTWCPITENKVEYIQISNTDKLKTYFLKKMS